MKQRTVIGLLAILAVVGLVLVFPSAKVDAGTNTKAAMATRLWQTSGHADKTAEPFKQRSTTLPLGSSTRFRWIPRPTSTAWCGT